MALLKVFGPFSYNLAGCVESIIKTTFKPAGYLSGVDGFKTETLTVENYEAAVQLVKTSTQDQPPALAPAQPKPRTRASSLFRTRARARAASLFRTSP